MTVVINLYGGPGTGKSTTAAGLFFAYKSNGANVELVREYAKDVVWEGRTALLQDQLYLFAKQNKRLFDLMDKVDLIITDSPLLQMLIYAESHPKALHDLIRLQHNKTASFDVFLRREKAYNPAGRVQTEDEAVAMDMRIRDMLVREGVKFIEVSANNMAIVEIAEALKREYGETAPA